MYAKLFTSIYQGTLRGNSRGLLVFTNLLAHADAAGHVDVHPRAIAEEVGLTVAEVRDALDELEAPDPESRSPEEDGRRLIRLDEHRAWGWRIVNYVKYRSIRSEEDRRAQNREAQKRWRDKQASDSDKQRKQRKPRKPPSAQAEAEAEAEDIESASALSARAHDEKQPTKAGTVCRAMMDAKLSAVNPGDPRLIALIDQGATVEEFTGLAAEAVSKGKGFAWVMHVLAARREEAAKLKLAPVVESGPSPMLAESEARRKREAEHAKASQSAEAHEARRRAMEAIRKV